MSKKIVINVLAGLVVLMLCVAATGSYAKENVNGGKTEGVAKTTTNDVYRPFLINSIMNWYSNCGDGSYNPNTLQSGFEYPKGSGKFCTFEDGVVWGGFHKGRSTAKVGGSTYWRGLQAGVILTPGGPTENETPVADNPDPEKYRPYTVRPDVTPHTAYADVQSKLEAEATLITKYSSISAQQLFDTYVKDWNEWPAKSAANPSGVAPFKDVNGDGLYDPAIDIPGQPGADETMYYVANDCDPSRSAAFAGSTVIGLEMHRTIWAYNQPGALGNTIFESTLLINKSGAPLDSTFLVEWADVDNGDANDDYSGCDVPRGLGYTYNGKSSDATYGTQVPAVGYTFFQGPIVATGNPSDSAVFRLERRYGYKNLGMTTFVFFINSNATYSDPAHGIGGDEGWYRLMNGLISGTGAPFINPLTNQPTKFTLDGDPVTGTGWIDGTYGLIPGDRRQCQVTGPFTLANGDTQEVVVAHLVGLGSDRISSVAVMKWYSDLAQTAYNSLFKIANPPPAPKVSVAVADGEVSLNWGDPNSNPSYGTIESYNSGGYAFEGYNVYQLPQGGSFDKNLATRLATYDKVDAVTTVFDDVYDAATGYIIKKPVQFGTDSDIRRRYDTKNDAINSKPLANGSPYYFAVTSYSVNADPLVIPTNLESSPEVLTIVPQTSKPGYTQEPIGDTLKTVTHTNSAGGLSDGQVIPIIVTPQQLTGGTYKVIFTGTMPNQTWTLIRTLSGRVDTLAKNLTDQSGNEAGAVIIDGIQWTVIGAPQDFKAFLTVANANGKLDPPQPGSFAFNSSGFPIGPPLLPDQDRPDGTIQQSAGLTVSSGWGIHTGMNAPDMSASYSYFKTRVTQSGARWPVIIPYDFEIRFTATGSEALFPSAFAGPVDRLVHVPFELWNIGINTPDNTADDYQMFANILDVDGSYTFNLLTQAGVDSVDNGGGGATHSISGGANDPFTDWIYWVEPSNTTPGHAGYDAIVAQVQADISGGQDPYLGGGTNGDVMRRMVLVGWNFGTVASGTYKQQMPEVGTIFRIVSTKPNQPTDQFTITTPTYQYDANNAKVAVGNVNVFPNPYIGFNPLEKNKYERFVTFSHLPNRATLRIFNLAGVLVRTLAKSSSDQFLQWDLKNESGFPVAAGMYIVYVDMPDIGTTKTLKLGVIPEQQYIDRW
jgi:hypothetical protein